MKAVMHKGFTVVELLIVIAVIGILASISLVAYNGAQNKGYDSAVQSDLDSAAGVIENFRVTLSSSHNFPSSTSDLTTVGLQASKASYDSAATANFIYCVNATDYQSYALLGLSRSGNAFVMTQDGFKSTGITKASFANAATACSGLGLSLVASGEGSGSWQSWVAGS